MIFKNLTVLPLLVFGLASCTSSQTKIRLKDKSTTPTLSFEKNNAVGVVQSSSNTKKFQTQIPDEFELEFYKSMEIDNVFLVYYQFETHDTAAGKIKAFKKESLEEIWTRNVNSFNLSIPLSNNYHIYVSAAGEFSKINLKTGETIWENKNLNEDVSLLDTNSVIKLNDKIIINEKYEISDTNGKLLSK